MGRLLIYDIVERPATSALIGICSSIWLYIQHKNLGYADVGLSYEAVVTEGQHWRLVTHAFSHISFLHLIFNMSALWSLGVVESRSEYGLGVAYYLHYSMVLLILSGLLVLGMYHVLIHQGKMDSYRRVTAVGYSCVVFGWMTILAVKQPSSKLDVLGVLSLPVSFAPFESLVVTSIIVPQASFLGHLSGIIVGYLIAWNFIRGVSSYWAISMAGWLGMGFLLSLKRTSSFEMPFLEIEDVANSSISTIGMVPSSSDSWGLDASALTGSQLV